jgi:hypothetical protein
MACKDDTSFTNSQISLDSSEVRQENTTTATTATTAKRLLTADIELMTTNKITVEPMVYTRADRDTS